MNKVSNSRYLTGALLISICAVFILSSCTQKKEGSYAEEDAATEEVVVEEDVWLIDEHKINEIPLTSAADVSTVTKSADDQMKEEAESAEAEMEEQVAEQIEEMEEEVAMEEAMEMEYEIAKAAALEEQLMEEEYVLENTFEVTQAVVPLDETQTVVAYNKKGQAMSAIQVVSSGDGEVEQVIFQDKKHKDVYDVQAGMTTKDAKKLRKELKHMEHKGKVYLYDDTSNIMYLTDYENLAGDVEITEADIENSEITAIIWKDKKHHKKMKEQS